MSQEHEGLSKKGVFIFGSVLVGIIVWASLAGQYGGWTVFWTVFGLILGVLAVTLAIYVWSTNSRKIINSILGIDGLLAATDKAVKKVVKPKAYTLLPDGTPNPLFDKKLSGPLPRELQEDTKRNAENRCQMWEKPNRQGRCKVVDAHAMQIHHINGTPGDHRRANLMYLCANHHSIITKTVKWREIPKKGSGDWKYTSEPIAPFHGSFFHFMRLNQSDNIQKLNERYFVHYQVQTKKE